MQAAGSIADPAEASYTVAADNKFAGAAVVDSSRIHRHIRIGHLLHN